MTIEDSPCCGKECFATFANVPLDTGSCMAFSAELLCVAEWALCGHYCIDEFDLTRIAQERVPLRITYPAEIVALVSSDCPPGYPMESSASIRFSCAEPSASPRSGR